MDVWCDDMDRLEHCFFDWPGVQMLEESARASALSIRLEVQRLE
jgi:hypothetical protein